MRACSKCFTAQTWVTSAFQGDVSVGNCDFGHGYANTLWEVTAWDDSLTRLLALYEIDDSGIGRPLQEQIQRDWQIFNLDPADLRAFLAASGVGADPLLASGVFVRLRGTGSGTDHIASWTRFADEIRTRNRYFPTAVPDLNVLKTVIQDSAKTIKKGMTLSRARLCTSEQPLATAAMGAPPAQLASAGRANPVGIPYLYLAFEVDTCIYEARVPNHGFICVGTFRLSRDVRILNLAEITPPDLFSAPDLDAVDDLVRSVLFYRYLAALGDELSKPVQSSDGPTDYIPTQYLCELAKSLNFDGVQYASSVYPAGHNVVLFDVDVAACEAVAVYQVTGLQATFEQVVPATV
jgi:hypothetical protein